MTNDGTDPPRILTFAVYDRRDERRRATRRRCTRRSPSRWNPPWDNGGCPNARYVSGFGGLYGSVGARDDDETARAEPATAAGGGEPRAGRPTDDDDDDARERQRRRVRTRMRRAVAVRPDIDSGGDTPQGEWPLAGTRDAGLLECLLARDVPAVAPSDAELSTTLVLTLLFNPKFKVAFASALVRHYRDLVLFPNTLPWPGVSRMDRGGSAPIASGLSDTSGSAER